MNGERWLQNPETISDSRRWLISSVPNNKWVTTSFGTSLQDITAARCPIILIEVKPWLLIYADNSKPEDCFEDSSMLGQLVEQGKFVFERSNVEIQANTSVVVVLAAGHMWRSAKLFTDNIFAIQTLTYRKSHPQSCFWIGLHSHALELPGTSSFTLQYLHYLRWS